MRGGKKFKIKSTIHRKCFYEEDGTSGNILQYKCHSPGWRVKIYIQKNYKYLNGIWWHCLLFFFHVDTRQYKISFLIFNLISFFHYFHPSHLVYFSPHVIFYIQNAHWNPLKIRFISNSSKQYNSLGEIFGGVFWSILQVTTYIGMGLRQYTLRLNRLCAANEKDNKFIRRIQKGYAVYVLFFFI